MIKHNGINVLLASAMLAFTGNVIAADACDNAAFNFFTDAANGWSLLANNDGNTDPGYGGQEFDAEYLFYKYDSTTNNLSIGLQTGFNLNDGKVSSYWKSYYAGDLALSFDGNTSTPGANGSGYEYAVDFGLATYDYNGYDKVSADVGYDDAKDAAGLYAVSKWNNDIYYVDESSPFAMDGGTLVASTANEKGAGWTKSSDYSSSCGGSYCYSYWRTATFNLDDIVGTAGDFTVDAHWTMSCGNDSINGGTVISRNDVAVPEPSILALFGLGSLTLVASGYRRRKMKV